MKYAFRLLILITMSCVFGCHDNSDSGSGVGISPPPPPPPPPPQPVVLLNCDFEGGLGTEWMIVQNYVATGWTGSSEAMIVRAQTEGYVLTDYGMVQTWEMFDWSQGLTLTFDAQLISPGDYLHIGFCCETGISIEKKWNWIKFGSSGSLECGYASGIYYWHSYKLVIDKDWNVTWYMDGVERYSGKVRHASSFLLIKSNTGAFVDNVRITVP